MLTTSDSTEQLDTALAKAQASIPEAELNCKNPYFNSVYADLTSVWRACRKSLTDNGISVTQWPVHSDDGRLHLITRLACAGEWMRCEFSTPVTKQDPQAYGSATTYLKRFALCAAVGVVGEGDDDGNAAATKPSQTPSQTTSPRPVASSEPPEFTQARESRERNEADAARIFNQSTASNDPNKPGVYQASKIAEAVQRRESVKNYAPGAENTPPMPESEAPEPDWVTDSAKPSPGGGSDYTMKDLAAYRVTFGKHNGKSIAEIGLKDAVNYLEWLLKQNQAAGEKLKPGVEKFRDMVNLAVNR